MRSCFGHQSRFDIPPTAWGNGHFVSVILTKDTRADGASMPNSRAAADAWIPGCEGQTSVAIFAIAAARHVPYAGSLSY